MAKSKHSVALFEVISASKSSNRAALGTPKWWFKSRKLEAPAGSEPAVVEVVESSAPAPRVPGVDLKLDPDRKRINFDVSYTSALVAAFTVMVTVGLAYIIGSHMTRGPAPAIAGASTEQLLKGPPQAGVLEVGSRLPAPATVIDSAPKTQRTETITPVVPAPPAGGRAGTPQAASAGSGQAAVRDINLNYLIIQSYPASEKAMAMEAYDLLNKNGVPCTVETNVPNYPNLYVVVGLKGFARPRTDPALADEVKKIVELSNKFYKDKSAGNSKFKKLDPLPQKWMGSEKTVSPG